MHAYRKDTVNLGLLVLSTLILGTAVTLTALPDYTARLIASWGGTAAMEDGSMGLAQRGVTVETRGEAVPAGQPGALGAVARVTLQVDGMT